MDFVGIEKLTLVDYPNKVACIVFTKGCNFRCPWCHNSSLVLSKNIDIIPFDDILSFLKKRRGIIDAVVISGGEPTLNNDIIDKIRIIKGLGYLIKLDTNGTNPGLVKELAKKKLIDYVAMDIKNSLEMYPNTIGLTNYKKEEVLETISFLKENNVDYEFRTTLIKEFHSLTSILKIEEMLSGSKKLFLQKFIDSDNCIITNKFHEVTKDDALKFKTILKESIECVELRGYE